MSNDNHYSKEIKEIRDKALRFRERFNEVILISKYLNNDENYQINDKSREKV
jgi:hypothetical protein